MHSVAACRPHRYEKENTKWFKVMLAECMVSNKELAAMLGKESATISKCVTITSQPIWVILLK